MVSEIHIGELVVIEPIEKIVEFVARLYLAEKGTGEPPK